MLCACAPIGANANSVRTLSAMSSVAALSHATDATSNCAGCTPLARSLKSVRRS